MKLTILIMKKVDNNTLRYMINSDAQAELCHHTSIAYFPNKNNLSPKGYYYSKKYKKIKKKR